MGMFDYVRCEVPLPDGYEGELQTKDFDCQMQQCVITMIGRLTVDGVDREFHGIFNFYDLDRNGKWHEYNAKFTDGQLVEIKQVQQ